MKFSIVIPAHNEEGCIGPTLEALTAKLADSEFDYEIVVVDDHCSDSTAEIVAKFAKEGEGHVITSSIEHSSVLNVFKELEKRGIEVTYLNVDEYGKIDPSELEAAIREDTLLVSIMYANNETGTIQDIKKLVDISHSKDVLFHTDAIQALGKIPVDVKELGADFMSISSPTLCPNWSLMFLK